jgi:hypothetical protein
MKRHGESHLDHGMSEPQIAFLLAHVADRAAFFIESVELPPELGTVPCGLHGPATGGEPVPDTEVEYVKRGTRAWPSRVCARAPVQSRFVTVIAGPHDDPDGTHHDCILYTMYGGPLAPREPGDTSLDDKGRAESEAFWKDHALSK